MAVHGYAATLPLLFLVIAMSAFIALGFSRGRKKNRKIYLSAFHDLMEIFKPDDQTFTNIGGLVGHHANFCFREKDIVSEIDATITLLPRHAPLYMPISRLIMKNDRLFITLYMRCSPPGEGHLIEKEYANFRGPKITNAYRLDREEIRWGKCSFYLYYERMTMYDHLTQFIQNNPDPGFVRHVAILPEQRKGFIFMIPQEGEVARHLKPIYELIVNIFGSLYNKKGSES
jgi:hypothetical protein